MVSVASQSDVSPGESSEFLLQHTAIPEEKEGQPELFSVITEHFSPKLHVPGDSIRTDLDSRVPP